MIQISSETRRIPILMEWDFSTIRSLSIAESGGRCLRKYAQQAESVAYIDTGWYRESKNPHRLLPD